jgi:hypothetical protein
MSITLSPPVFDTSIPTRAYADAMVSVVVGAVGGRTGWVDGSNSVTSVASLTRSYSNATARNEAVL